MNKNGKVTIITDLQFGSTGKGLIAGYLAKRDRPDTLVTTWMPNAGHTFIDADGTKYIHTMLANGIVSDSVHTVMIGPGSMINIDNLLCEYKNAVKVTGRTFRILVHPHAGIVRPEHRAEESGPMTKIGSTKKGCGAALIQRIQRDPDSNNTALASRHLFPFSWVVNINQWNRALKEAESIQFEMAQGFSLSIYHGFYPYCTSRDVTPAQGMADAGMPLSWLKKVVGACRTFPIRVANRYQDGHHGEDDKMIGWSGPCYPDQEEIDWDYVEVEPELTTVTKLPRRIFTFSEQQMKDAIFICEPDEIFLNFCNYLDADKVRGLVNKIQDMGSYVRYLGWGANETDIEERP